MKKKENQKAIIRAKQEITEIPVMHAYWIFFFFFLLYPKTTSLCTKFLFKSKQYKSKTTAGKISKTRHSLCQNTHHFRLTCQSILGNMVKRQICKFVRNSE